MPSMSSSPEVIRLGLLVGSASRVRGLVVVGSQILSWGAVSGLRHVIENLSPTPRQRPTSICTATVGALSTSPATSLSLGFFTFLSLGIIISALIIPRVFILVAVGTS